MDLSGKGIEVMPCPCCASELVRMGVLSAQSFGVVCQKCGLRMEEYIPNGWPRGVWIKGRKSDYNYRRLEVWTTLKAVKRWNRRPKKSKPSATSAHEC